VHNYRHLPSPKHLMLKELTRLKEEEVKKWRRRARHERGRVDRVEEGGEGEERRVRDR
jgi:hypothetical protein